jgi:hypothetical protein
MNRKTALCDQNSVALFVAICFFAERKWLHIGV